jgi:pyruvate dehydrogenase E1 component alpha subunit
MTEKIDNEKLLAMYKNMVTIRLFENQVSDLFAAGKLPGFIHLYIGEEAVATGVCANLKEQDYITSTHRGHGHLIAKGGDLNKMMAELYGKRSGYCKGKGGSMHIADVDLGILGANGIVGGGPPIATGAAFGIKYQGSDGVVVCFFGDAASNQGTFHEGLNLASVWKLPVIFVCENNLYGISVSQARHQNISDVADRANAYDIPGVVVDGNDVMAVYEAAGEAIGAPAPGKAPA